MDIELVIKIPEEIYESSKIECDENDSFIIDTFTYAIGNGTPLPKGHGRLIDTDALYNDLIFPNEQFGKAFKDILDDAPTIIPAEREEE